MVASGSKADVKIYVFEVDTQLIADGLRVQEQHVREKMTDGRVASTWAESWGATLESLQKATDSNNKFSDAVASVGSTDFEYSNKTLTQRGVKFQASSNVGSGRTCTKHDLIAALDEVDVVQVVDITPIPKVRVITFKSRFLRRAAETDKLTRSGWSAKKFYGWLFETFNVELQEVLFDGETGDIAYGSAKRVTSIDDLD